MESIETQFRIKVSESNGEVYNIKHSESAKCWYIHSKNGNFLSAKISTGESIDYENAKKVLWYYLQSRDNAI